MTQRRADLDALRSFAMLLGIALHSSMSFIVFPWPIHDTHSSNLLLLFLVAVHGFRMPLFFLLSGYFTMLVYRRKGMSKLLEQRVSRILVPLLIGLITIIPLNSMLERFVSSSIKPAPEFAPLFSGDEVAIQQMFGASHATEQKDSFWDRSPLAWAALGGDSKTVSILLDSGADLHERDRNGNTLLHFAATFGRDAVGEILVERGADPLARNALGMVPSAGLSIPAEQVSEYGPYLDLPAVSVDEILRGRERLRKTLPQSESSEDWVVRIANRVAQFQSSDVFRLSLGTLTLQLFETNVFYHLWFLWFLCWMVLLFAILVKTRLIPTSRIRGFLMIASCVPHLFMGVFLAGGFGPDTSLGVLPKLPVFLYYCCFFFFGCAMYEANGLQQPAGNAWKIMLIVALPLFIAGLATTNHRLLAAFLQPAFAWTMSLGSIGAFAFLSSKYKWLGENPAVAWMADASYWMYLIHVPLVIGAQWLVRGWPLPVELKFCLVLAIVFIVLLISYRWCVRYTFIGRQLNGPRLFGKKND